MLPRMPCGKTTEQTSITYTFVVVADEEGQINLDGATIQVGGNQLTSNKLTINVLPPDQTTAAQSQNAGQGSARSAQQQGSTASAGSSQGDDLFMVATVDKTTVYEQEAILLTPK